jgi:anti-sigma regulatory factor (Ser/Thr protein kinase)
VEEQVKKFKTERIGGWGLFLMKSLVDEVDIVGSDGQGTTATLRITTES